MSLEKTDKEVFDVVKKEEERQQLTIELIASENFVTKAVLEANATVLTNKYAEGYPGKRYYGGCVWYDVVEDLARERVKKLFNAEHANVQPHSGSQANMGVFFAFLKPGDTILAMDLSHGGHLTHGSPVNFSGILYNFVHYGVNKETEVIDYDNVRKIALEHKPKIILCGTSAYSRTIHFEKLKGIADEVGAYLMADVAHIAGLIVAGEHPSPFPWCDFVTTTTQKTLRGPRGGVILCKKEFAEKVDKSIFPGIQGGPMMHTIAAKAVAFKEAMTEDFKEYQKQIRKNAEALSEGMKSNGFRIISDGTDTHLMLVDLSNKNITGIEAQELLEEVGITLNKNMIPFDTRSPKVTSGVRIGTPAVTTRAMKEPEMKEIADLISKTIENKDNQEVKDEIKEQVINLCKRFPLYY